LKFFDFVAFPVVEPAALLGRVGESGEYTFQA
jgi:hypothetical protein